MSLSVRVWTPSKIKKERPLVGYPREKLHRPVRTDSGTVEINSTEPWSRALPSERIGPGPPGTGCNLLLDSLPCRFIPDNPTLY